LVRVVSDIAVPPATSSIFSDYTYNKGYLIVPKDVKFEYETTNGWKQFASIYEAGSVDKTDFTITIEQEGTLSDAVEALETSLVENLTIKGRLNGKDIAYLVSQKGKVAHLCSLDLKDVTLVGDNTMYQSDFYGVSEAGASTETTCYYLSDGNYKREEWVSNGLGGYKTTIHYYNNHLAGAFHDMNLRKIVMPASITQIGERTFQDNKLLEEVWFPESVTAIGGGHPGRNAYAGAFYKCSSLTNIPSLAHIENIEEAAFAYCTNITGEIDLSSAKTIKEDAFYVCTGISSVKFSSKLESVEGEAFAGCSTLSDVSFDENADVIYSRTSFSNTPWNEKLPTENGIVYMGKVAMAVEQGTEPRELTFREGTISIAHDFLDGNTYEKIRTVNLPNSVKRIGNDAFYAGEYIYSSNYGSNIEFINFPEGLIEVGSHAFAYNKRIQKLALPNSVRYVGASAFARMEKLQSVENYNVPRSDNSTFYYCDLLESVIIGSNVETISKGMFANCKKLAKVEFEQRNNRLPLSIEDGAFSSCENITEIILPEGVDSIGKEAFRGCSGLTSIKIPSTLKSIEESAFSSCKNLQKVYIEDIAAWCNNTFHESLSFEKHLYMNDEEIKDLIIPNTATSIADYAFWKCIGLTSVTISNNVTSIGYDAFAGCSSLNSATIGSGVTSINDGAFSGCSSLTTINIPNNVTSLGSSAFTYCRALASATIGDGVTSIGNNTFYWCTALSSVIIGNGVTSIGNEAFYECDALTSVTIGSGVTSISERAFYYCRDLTDVYCYAENAPSTYSDTFMSSYIRNATLHVPSASVNVYKSTYPWRSFGSIVKIDMPKHTLTYMVDGEVYKTYRIEEGETITPEPAPTKEGYTFSGWSDIPETMPDHDVTVTGTFSINSYKLTYMIDDKVYKETIYEYGATITPEPKPEGDYATFEWKDLPETMPAHDVVVYASYTYEPTIDDTVEPYTVLSDDKETLTFYYDNKRVERGGSILGKTFSYISDRPWDRSAESIKTAVFDESFSNYNDLQGTCYWFFNCKNLTEIIGLQYLNTDRVYDMRCMFEYCSSLTSLDLSSFSTKSAYILTGMFNGCSALTTLNLSGFNTAITQYMVGMFMDCNKLNTIYVGKTWSTESVINGSNMFSGCTSLVGGSGTSFDVNHIDYEYARIDGGAAAPGYFTDINDVSDVKSAIISQQADRQYFTIDGRKLLGQPTTKGIYIVNGKVIVKQ